MNNHLLRRFHHVLFCILGIFGTYAIRLSGNPFGKIFDEAELNEPISHLTWQRNKIIAVTPNGLTKWTVNPHRKMDEAIDLSFDAVNVESLQLFHQYIIYKYDGAHINLPRITLLDTQRDVVLPHHPFISSALTPDHKYLLTLNERVHLQLISLTGKSHIAVELDDALNDITLHDKLISIPSSDGYSFGLLGNDNETGKLLFLRLHITLFDAGYSASLKSQHLAVDSDNLDSPFITASYDVDANKLDNPFITASPDGKQLAVYTDDYYTLLFALNDSTDTLKPFMEVKAAHPKWCPIDSRYISLEYYDETYEKDYLKIIDIVSGQDVTILHPSMTAHLDEYIMSYCWSPSGTRLAVAFDKTIIIWDVMHILIPQMHELITRELTGANLTPMIQPRLTGCLEELLLSLEEDGSDHEKSDDETSSSTELILEDMRTLFSQIDRSSIS